ncbi:uncharacterized protein LOC133915729 [Phragmites australis]|uniref:uncharacterized protein LOC133915729 n=1 Tax=Phragmites australis TaxID=29695 RepID=UPI002D76F1A3|nr:uncharacterized protein LOC133915729 [Phragmites australis]
MARKWSKGLVARVYKYSSPSVFQPPPSPHQFRFHIASIEQHSAVSSSAACLGVSEAEEGKLEEAEAMCYQVKCGACGKSTWAGCGRHVASVHRQIPEGQHCACRDWPGVVPAGDNAAADGAAEGSSSSSTSTCAIL